MYIKNIFLSFCLAVFFCHAQTTLQQPTFSSSAVQANSQSSILIGTSGQVFVGKGTSESTILVAGLWGSISSILLGVDDLIPLEFSLSNAYPNPFNPTVNIDFTIPEQTDVNIQIFDLLGRNVFTHKQTFSTPGNYNFKWHGMKNTGVSVASGIYLVNIQHKSKFYQQKITFLK